MVDYSSLKTTKRTSEKAIPDNPKLCDCGKESAVTLLAVHNNGRLQVRPFSEVGYWDKNGDKVLKDQNSYSHWVPRCSECFYKVQPINTVSSFTANEIRHSWMWFIAKQTEGTKLAMFQGRTFSPDQEDRFLFVVNHEAKRLNQPDAIPREYRLREVWQ